MRDAQSLLDQLLAFGDDKLTVASVHQLLGTTNEERVAALASAALEHDAKQTLALLDQVVEQGQQLGELLDQLIEYWRDLMVVQCAGSAHQALSVTGARRDALHKQAQSLQPDSIMAGLDILVAAKNRLRFTSHARIVLEMALVRLSRLDDLLPLSQLAQWVAQEGDGSPPAPASASRVSAVATPGRKKKRQPMRQRPRPISSN
jgi:DNA polymerase-3 subunit gamma/tau